MKEAEEIPQNKLCVDLIGPYTIKRQGQKEILNIKSVNMIYPVTMWFEIMHYGYKRVISIKNLVDTTWLTRYPRPMEITNDQG